MALQLVGAPQVSNSLAAAAVACESCLPAHQVAEQLGDATTQFPWRMESGH
ncbi:hypothetical protein ACWGCW_10245 [Streptomyces sp. NPDC054933]